MRIDVHKEHLQRALLAVERITARNATLPILANILFEAEPGLVRLTATNLEIGITASMSAKSEGALRCAVPGKVLSEFIKISRGDIVSFEATTTALSISVGGNRTKILCSDAAEYPITPKLDGGFSVSLPIISVQAMFISALDSIPVSDSRPELSGAYLSFEQNTVTVAATDSFRLVERQVPSLQQEVSSVIIPRGTVAEVLRVISGTEGTVMLRVADNQISFTVGDIIIVSRLIDGRYPDYKKVIPEQFVTKALVRRDELEQAAKAAALFSSSISDIQLSCNESTLTMSARSAEKGEASADIEVQLKGEPFTLSMNYHYLLDGLRIMQSEYVVLQFTGKGSPFVIRPGTEEKDLLYLIMPLRN